MEEWRLGVIADRRLWLTADRKRVVEDGDQAAAFLLAGGPGAVIDDAEADRLGILGRPLLGVEAGQVPAPDAGLVVETQSRRARRRA